MKWALWREVVAFLFGGLSWHHTPPLPPPAAVCTRFQLYGNSDMCHALETAVEWLSLTSIFPDRPHRWLLGKQGPEWLESALLNDLEEGAGRDPHWGLVNSFRITQVTQKHAVQYWKKGRSICRHWIFFLYIKFDPAFIPYLEWFTRVSTVLHAFFMKYVDSSPERIG